MRIARRRQQRHRMVEEDLLGTRVELREQRSRLQHAVTAQMTAKSRLLGTTAAHEAAKQDRAAVQTALMARVNELDKEVSVAPFSEPLGLAQRTTGTCCH